MPQSAVVGGRGLHKTPWLSDEAAGGRHNIVWPRKLQVGLNRIFTFLGIRLF